ncbi:MAG: BlaI/MecI/CopY family transcriptional regulator [Alphaproteobacteria bacterium]|nr:BlaI/MecI/CopY family transcriptional regulator [Alphaproteobacteria bacterium]
MTKPTDKELELLNILWDKGQATVKELHDELIKFKEVGYTTVLKFMQILTEKKMVVFFKDQKHHVYSPSVTREEVQKNYLQNMTRSLFKGSTFNLVLNALGNDHNINKADLESIKKIIENLDATSNA